MKGTLITICIADTCFVSAKGPVTSQVVVSSSCLFITIIAHIR